MKKNKMMRAASGLLVATLFTTSVISGTFAKYVTQDSATDTARVAKWGVVAAVSGDLFGTNYMTYVAADGSTAESGNVVVTDGTNTGISVVGTQISDSTNVVAPGTKNEEGFKFYVLGKPEVSSKVTMDVTTQNIYLKQNTYGMMVKVGTLSNETYDDLMAETAVDGGLYVLSAGTYTKATEWAKATEYYTLEDYVVLSKDYYPVVYKLSGTETTIDEDGTIDSDSLAEIAATIVARVKANVEATNSEKSTITYTDVESDVYAPNTDLADEKSLNLNDETITWEWAIENGTDAESKKMYNGADTILGNLMAARVNTEDFIGTVVEATYDSTNTTEIVSWSAPAEHTDFCLDTKFAIDITVEQVD